MISRFKEAAECETRLDIYDKILYMNINELIMLSVALATDAMLVSFSYGLVICNNRIKNSLYLAVFFGLFQFIMPVLGWILTGFVYEYLKIYSKIIVFIIFLILGLKFLHDAFCENKEKISDCISLICILGLSLATSIDALGAGISLKLLDVNVIKAAILIGIITFILSETGFHAGNIFCKIQKQYALITGSLFLFYLAYKSLVY